MHSNGYILGSITITIIRAFKSFKTCKTISVEKYNGTYSISMTSQNSKKSLFTIWAIAFETLKLTCLKTWIKAHH